MHHMMVEEWILRDEWRMATCMHCQVCGKKVSKRWVVGRVQTRSTVISKSALSNRWVSVRMKNIGTHASTI